MSEQQAQGGIDIPIEYMESDEFVFPKKVSDKFVDYDMTKKEGREILQESKEANELSETERQLVLLQGLRQALSQKLSREESKQYYESPESILAA